MKCLGCFVPKLRIWGLVFVMLNFIKTSKMEGIIFKTKEIMNKVLSEIDLNNAEADLKKAIENNEVFYYDSNGKIKRLKK